MMTATEAEEGGFRGRLRELQTECGAMHTVVLAGSVDVVQMAERYLTLEKHSKKSV